MRILSATHKNLARLVELGSFRQDLFYRINVIELRVPPLRERREDIPKLAARVLERLAGESGTAPARLAPEALKALLAYDFPGNVRELENVLERAVAMCENGNITAEDLRLSTRAASAPAGPPAAPSRCRQHRTTLRAGDTAARAARAARPTPRRGVTKSFPGDLAAAVAETERAAIMKALEATRWNRTAAAKQARPDAAAAALPAGKTRHRVTSCGGGRGEDRLGEDRLDPLRCL